MRLKERWIEGQAMVKCWKDEGEEVGDAHEDYWTS